MQQQRARNLAAKCEYVKQPTRKSRDRVAEEAILAVMRAETTAFFHKDFDAVAGHWMHGAEVRRTISGAFCVTRVSVGWEDIATGMKAGMRRFPQSIEFDEWLRWDQLQIHAGIDMAWASYDQVAIRPNADIQASCLQHETRILHAVNGTWKLASLSIVVPGTGRNDTPQIELNNDGRIVHLNPLAKARLRHHPGLHISRDCLRARQPGFDAGLQSTIRGVLEQLNATLPPSLFQHRTGQVVPLGEDASGYPVYCWVMLEQERVVVSIDNTYLMEIRLDHGADLYSLSPAQRSLAKLLAAGINLVSAAGSWRSASIHYARNCSACSKKPEHATRPH